jgi:AcrR family transcriptional regulator
MGMRGTKWEIFCCAIYFFAENDYTAVSIRQIANDVGIGPSALYNHFKSKDEIVDTMYAYQKRYGRTQIYTIEQLLHLAETMEPRAALRQMHTYYPAEIQVIMDRLTLIAYKMMRYDKRADDIINWQIIEQPKMYFTPVLKRMLELGRIEPLDIEALIELITNSYYGAALRMYSSHSIDPKLWVRSWEQLFDIVIPTGK